jgi:hypothetical protein
LVTNRAITEYTLRAIPQHADAIVPLETAEILWER